MENRIVIFNGKHNATIVTTRSLYLYASPGNGDVGLEESVCNEVNQMKSYLQKNCLAKVNQ